MADGPDQARLGRRAALLFAASGIFFVLTMLLEQHYGFAPRIGALLNLIALAGFAAGLYVTYRAWVAGRGGRG